MRRYSAPPRATQATGSGPEIAIGTPSLGAGEVHIPVYALGVVGNPYEAFTLHVRWDPTLFGFSSITASGGVFDPSASPGTGFCASANTAVYDGDGGGVVFGCVGFASTSASGRLLATVALTPLGSGCSAIHLFTHAGADDGDENDGTFTVNATDTTAQSNTYADGTASTSGGTCTPPMRSGPATGMSSPAPHVPATPDCTHDLNADGSDNILDLSKASLAFLTLPGNSNWNAAADLNADDRVNIIDLSLISNTFLASVVNCVPGYPFYNPGPSWDGSLPNGYNASQYYINTGAMVYDANNYACPWPFPQLSGWAFDSPTHQTNVSACAMASDLATLINDLGLWEYAHGLSGDAHVYFGPNDCMSHLSTKSIADSAATLAGLISIANGFSQSNDNNRVQFTAEVDDEGYDPSNCDTANETQCRTSDVTFFLDYAGGVIGPAGARPCEAGDETALSLDGLGEAIPQVYVYSGAQALTAIGPPPVGCRIDGLDPANGTWPYAIPYGYAGVQSYPIPSGYYTSWQANIRWSLCHGTAPAFDFDWSFPGGRG